MMPLRHFRTKIQWAKEKQLEELDLSWDKLKPQKERLPQIPNEVFGLTQLKVLNLSFNELTSLPETIEQLQNLTTLDLRGNRLTTLPETIGQLKNLTSLDLSYNELATLPKAIGQLHNLSTLNLTNNRLITLPETIWQLHELSMLHLNRNGVTTLPETIDQLKNLTLLDLSYNELATLPKTIGQLEKLVTLNLSGNRLTALPETIGQLENLITLDLRNNPLTILPKMIGQLENLVTLNLSGNRLTALLEMIGQLENLITLDLHNNPLASLPKTIGQLENLATLNLSGNRLTALPETIGQLENLITLDLHNNPLTTLPVAIGQLENLVTLDLSSNPLETPPPEIVAKGLIAIKEYFRQLATEGKDYLYEAKLLIIGEGGAGKTTLANKIRDAAYQLHDDEESTQGIEVIRWEFPLPPDLIDLQNRSGLKDKKFRINIWDFGGQEIYHATHQFFLTKRSLYALVADTRKEDTDFYYWLNIVELLSDNSPLLIVKNEKQDRHREINERQLRGQFTNFKETLATNLATNRGLPDVVSQIKHYISHLPHVGAELPKTWVKVRAVLENDPRHYISLDEYLHICEKNGFRQLKDSLQLSGYLHDLGVCLHFQ